MHNNIPCENFLKYVDNSRRGLNNLTRNVKEKYKNVKFLSLYIFMTYNQSGHAIIPQSPHIEYTFLYLTFSSIIYVYTWL